MPASAALRSAYVLIKLFSITHLWKGIIRNFPHVLVCLFLRAHEVELLYPNYPHNSPLPKRIAQETDSVPARTYFDASGPGMKSLCNDRVT